MSERFSIGQKVVAIKVTDERSYESTMMIRATFGVITKIKSITIVSSEGTETERRYVIKYWDGGTHVEREWEERNIELSEEMEQILNNIKESYQ